MSERAADHAGPDEGNLVACHVRIFSLNLRPGDARDELEAREERGMMPEFALGNSSALYKVQTIIFG